MLSTAPRLPALRLIASARAASRHRRGAMTLWPLIALFQDLKKRSPVNLSQKTRSPSHGPGGVGHS
jgi:hypothetical protein